MAQALGKDLGRGEVLQRRVSPAGTPVTTARACRHLVVVLGDQLDAQSSAWDGFDATQDLVWMAEVADESTHVWSAKQRIALFLSAMRHFAADLHARQVPLSYHPLDEQHTRLSDALQSALSEHRPHAVVVTAPGDWRVLQMLRTVTAAASVALDVREDRHFLCSVRAFAEHARGRKQLRMEFFYREQRRRHRVLMDGDQPAGGAWNFDADNRESFGRAGPGELPTPLRFAPDTITTEVIALVQRRFADHPGSLDSFGWAVTPAQARAALDDFIAHRLPQFGTWQDAMWAGEPWLFHSLVSSSLNLKLLDPRDVLRAAEDAWRAGHVPLAAAEGFIRQVLGWREYVRGIYWTRMPGYADMNALDAQAPLPDWYWTGHTPMACLRDAIGQTLAHGYAHHIQRLMVTGLYALLLGVAPREVHQWYLAVYVDAVEWVELPNTLGMGQYADGGMMASKPYIASGKYIERMSNHCSGCQYDPALRTGDAACPFTTLYWDFLARHEALLANNTRMRPQFMNLKRLDADEQKKIAAQARRLRESGGLPPP